MLLQNDQMNEAGAFYLASKANRCVACGTTDHYLKYRCVQTLAVSCLHLVLTMPHVSEHVYHLSNMCALPAHTIIMYSTLCPRQCCIVQDRARLLP